MKISNNTQEAKAAKLDGNHPRGGFLMTVRGGSVRGRSGIRSVASSMR
jgi:hypothetical protein